MNSQVLFATTNPAKVGKYKKVLEEKGIELITIKDLDVKLDIDENGKDSIEQRKIKNRIKIKIIQMMLLSLL